MTLAHLTPEPFALDRLRTYEQPTSERKPNGLWLSVDGDWERWCEDESFRPETLVHSTPVALQWSGILLISDARALDAFTSRYRTHLPRWQLDDGIDWRRMAEGYDGICIAPYIWERRLGGDTRWYYTWDCASACVWNLSAVDVVRDEVST